MRHVIGPSWACTECQVDEEIPDDVNLSVLTVWNGFMVCLYHLPKLVERWKKEQHRKDFTGFTTIKDVPTGDQRLPQVNCAKVGRQETHDSHQWLFQPEDDSPRTIFALCLGYSQGGE